MVSSWARRSGRNDLRILAEGPASQVFARKLPSQPPLATGLEAALDGVASVLTGTSWASDLERNAIRMARGRGIRVASFLDHWVNYPQRFTSGAHMLLPDEVWVGDSDALLIAQRHFPQGVLRLEPNPYFEDVRDELRRTASPPAAAQLRVLYVSEPISEHFALEPYRHDHPGYDEFKALSYCLRKLSAQPEAIIRLRLHPAEKADKYSGVLQHFAALRLHVSSGTSLVEDCAWAQRVVGCETTAMVIGLIAGREVYTAIPPGGRPCALPQRQIKPL